MPNPGPLSRRAVIAGAGLTAGLVLTGCSSWSAASERTPTPAEPGTVLGPTSDVPVGSAAIFAEHGVVVTQPTPGAFSGFSTICPHQGCAVAAIENAHIVCPCHGSTFALDGTVIVGPAPTGLQPLPITVANGQLTVAP